MQADDHERPGVPRTTLVGAIAELHRSHEERLLRAATVRGAEVAGVDPEAGRVVAELAPRCNAKVVPLAEARLAVRSGLGLAVAVPRAAAVVDVGEFREMVAAYETTYRGAAAIEAVRRARIEANAAHRARSGRTLPAQTRYLPSAARGMRTLGHDGQASALDRRLREERAA